MLMTSDPSVGEGADTSPCCAWGGNMKITTQSLPQDACHDPR